MFIAGTADGTADVARSARLLLVLPLLLVAVSAGCPAAAGLLPMISGMTARRPGVSHMYSRDVCSCMSHVCNTT